MDTPSPAPVMNPVDRYLALTVRLLAMGEDDARREALEDQMDGAWNALSATQIDEVNALVAGVVKRPDMPEFTTGDVDLDALLSATVGLTDSPNQDSGLDWLNCLEKVKARLAIASTEALDLTALDASSVDLIGKAFRAVLSDPQVGWRKKDDSSFVPLIIDRLARQPALEPSDEAHGQAFLEVLRDPACAWRHTPAAPFISRVAQVAAELSLSTPGQPLALCPPSHPA